MEGKPDEIRTATNPKPMPQPQRILATLPALGLIPIDFHNESSAVWDFIGEKERRRLRDVPHLGVAASVFTGINHSRLEYTLLQCAVITHVKKLFKDDERIGLASKVRLNGLDEHVSSGEELLKCWALLSNYGHAQFTYGTERSLLQHALESNTFCRWLTSCSPHQDLNKWCRLVVDNYDDANFHFVLCVRRLRSDAPRDRRKAAFVHYLRNLLLPLDQLYPSNSSQRYKIGRLRSLYHNVRLLCMVTLDSYYSAHPFRFQLGAAISGLSGFGGKDHGRDGFGDVLRQMAGWLAEELYLHPHAVAAQRGYEVRAKPSISRRFNRTNRRSAPAARFLREILNDGLGKPRPNSLRHLVRFTLRSLRPSLLGRAHPNLYSVLRYLEASLCQDPYSYASIDRNPFSGVFYVDILYRHPEADPTAIASTLARVRKWLIRSVEADALASFRHTYPSRMRTGEDRLLIERMRVQFMRRRLREFTESFTNLFSAIIAYILPEGWTGQVSEYIPSGNRDSPILYRVRDSSGAIHNPALDRINELLDAGTPAVTADRLQELRTLKRVITRSRASLLLVCVEKFLIRDQYGKHRDDWDGVAVGIDDSGVSLIIIEAKDTRNRSRNESEAFDQLLQTAMYLRQRHILRYRRMRVTGLGAQIRLSIPSTNPD